MQSAIGKGIVRVAVAVAVEALENDRPAAWENPKTGAYGTLASVAAKPL